jgi:Tol biopolymer transport system component
VVGNADGGPADIWITDLAADHLLRLTMTDQRAEDSPVGWLAHPEWVLFNSYPADAEQPMLAGRLTAIRTDGTGYAVLDGEHSSCYPPAPSPNGQQIAFGCDASLWLYDWKAGRAATLNPTEYGFENVEGQWFIHPAWSPDGAKVSWSWVSGWESGGVEQAGIIVFDLAAKTHQLLHLHTPMTPIPPGKLVWSADGRQVAFSAFATDVMREAVWLSNTDWGSEIRISNAEFTPATFSADGKWLVLQATNIGIYRAMPGIWLADTANGQLYQVSMPLVVNGSEVQVTYPSWLSWPSP